MRHTSFSNLVKKLGLSDGVYTHTVLSVEQRSCLATCRTRYGSKSACDHCDQLSPTSTKLHPKWNRTISEEVVVLEGKTMRQPTHNDLVKKYSK